MSNKTSLVRTKFTDLATGEETFGFRIYCDYSNGYCNIFKNKPDDDDLDFLAMAVEMANGETKNIFENLKNGFGINIDGIWYDYDEIQCIL